MRETLPSGTSVEVVRPIAAGANRGVVIVPDIMGLRPLFEDMATALAAEDGWAVAVVEPFAGKEALPLEQRLESGVAELDDERVLGDLVDAAAQLGTERVAVMGFCMGGMYTLKAAGTGRFDRAGAFYGMIRLPEQFRGAGHREPLDYLRRPGRCPVLA